MQPALSLSLTAHSPKSAIRLATPQKSWHLVSELQSRELVGWPRSDSATPINIGLSIRTEYTQHKSVYTAHTYVYIHVFSMSLLIFAIHSSFPSSSMDDTLYFWWGSSPFTPDWFTMTFSQNLSTYLVPDGTLHIKGMLRNCYICTVQIRYLIVLKHVPKPVCSTVHPSVQRSVFADLYRMLKTWRRIAMI